MRSSLILFFFFFCNGLFAQSLFKGKVVSDPGDVPIPYANIGILHTQIGTLSNEDGTFSIYIPEGYNKDMLLFSALGFERKNVPVNQLSSESRIVVRLAVRVLALDTVLIVGKKEKNKIFEMGNSDAKGGVFATDTVYAGASKAILIRNSPPTYYKDFDFPVYVEKAKLKIFRNNWPTFKYRIRFYDVDSLNGGQPGKDLLNESIVVESSLRKGWMEVDLAHLKFKVDGPFFVAFEPILEDKDRLTIIEKFRDFKAKNPNKVRIDTVMVDGKPSIREVVDWTDFPGTAVAISPAKKTQEQFVCYSRDSSFAKWRKVRGILAATVMLTNQPITRTSPAAQRKDEKSKR